MNIKKRIKSDKRLIILFICGAHASGKSTIIKYLKDQNIIDHMGLEIGKKLFYQRNITTDQVDSTFDLDIVDMELKRDTVFARKNGIIAIESWHPGNLSYVMVRNPNLKDFIIEKINQSPLINNCYGIWLSVNFETIFDRTITFRDCREWASTFYMRIENTIPIALETLGLSNKIIKIDANRPFSDIISQIKDYIDKIKCV